MYTGPVTMDKPQELMRVTMVQNARAVFTDFKANNFAYLQNVYKYVDPLHSTF